MRILIVDDEPGIRQLCARALTAEGHEVSACDSGDSALPRLAERWDMIISDLTMPGAVDGHEVLRRARAAGAPAVALMTAYPTVGSTIAALREGACDYLLKPFALESLLDLVRRGQRRLPAALPAIEPRRLREATILFADVRGFTAFSESCAADVAATRLDALLACFIDAVHSEGGTINKLIGDGAMAVFGVPMPHAEPAAAAARAALRTRAAVARLGGLRFGFGINTGSVAAGCLGTGASAEYGVIGSAVNLAARLEELAGPGVILVGERTALALPPLFHLGASRAIKLDGLSALARVSELLA